MKNKQHASACYDIAPLVLVRMCWGPDLTFVLFLTSYPFCINNEFFADPNRAFEDIVHNKENKLSKI